VDVQTNETEAMSFFIFFLEFRRCLAAELLLGGNGSARGPGPKGREVSGVASSALIWNR
jgi:hypothetical protein